MGNFRPKLGTFGLQCQKPNRDLRTTGFLSHRDVKNILEERKTNPQQTELWPTGLHNVESKLQWASRIFPTVNLVTTARKHSLYTEE